MDATTEGAVQANNVAIPGDFDMPLPVKRPHRRLRNSKSPSPQQ